MPWLRWLCCSFLAVLATARHAHAQADTTLTVLLGGQLQLITPQGYRSPAGVHVRKYKLLLTLAQAKDAQLQFVAPGADSVQVKVMSVVGMRSFATRTIAQTGQVTIALGPLAAQELDCGTAQPCHASRLVIDFKLPGQGHRLLWVCQIVLEDE